MLTKQDMKTLHRGRAVYILLAIIARQQNRNKSVSCQDTEHYFLRLQLMRSRLDNCKRLSNLNPRA